MPQSSPIPDMARQALRGARKLIVLVVGGTVVLAGVVMLVTPGPAFLVIPAGIAILATEFLWARHLLKRIRRQVAAVANNLKGTPVRTSEEPCQSTSQASEATPRDATGTASACGCNGPTGDHAPHRVEAHREPFRPEPARDACL